MTRCPNCNANRTVVASVGTGKPGMRCTVCMAQWCGELYTDKEMKFHNMTIGDLVTV